MEKIHSFVDKSRICYQRCSEIDGTYVHQAFQQGFSDYVIKMEITKDFFLKRFFGPEGNAMESSFIAFYDDEPVGVILGGIRNYEGIKTMRCGALAISPDYRGTGISKSLFELHKEEAVKQGCKQLFLEVIVGNDRAIHFYKKLGYEKIYDLVYFRNENCSRFDRVNKNYGFIVTEMEFDEFKAAVQNWHYHINWQNDIDYLEKLPHTHCYGAYQEGNLIGCLAISQNGAISFLMVEKRARGKGIGTALLQTACEELQLAKMSSGFPNNSQLEGFFKKQGFIKDQLSQYEMYLVL